MLETWADLYQLDLAGTSPLEVFKSTLNNEIRKKKKLYNI